METFTINGVNYHIEYKPELSNNDYTQHHVYFIKTKEETSWPTARRNIAAIMAKFLGYNNPKEIWDKGLRIIKMKKEGIFAALHVYYEFDYDAENDQFIYTFVRPYDD